MKLEWIVRINQLMETEQTATLRRLKRKTFVQEEMKISEKNANCRT